jgi:hypothetical protein
MILKKVMGSIAAVTPSRTHRKQRLASVLLPKGDREV